MEKVLHMDIHEIALDEGMGQDARTVVQGYHEVGSNSRIYIEAL